jgi:hypothetical protein
MSYRSSRTIQWLRGKNNIRQREALDMFECILVGFEIRIISGEDVATYLSPRADQPKSLHAFFKPGVRRARPPKIAFVMMTNRIRGDSLPGKRYLI